MVSPCFLISLISRTSYILGIVCDSRANEKAKMAGKKGGVRVDLSRPVLILLALNDAWKVTGRVATGVPIFKSQVYLKHDIS